MSFQDLLWNIPTSSLVILATSVVEIWCRKTTDTQRNGSEVPTHTTAFGVGY